MNRLLLLSAVALVGCGTPNGTDGGTGGGTATGGGGVTGGGGGGSTGGGSGGGAAGGGSAGGGGGSTFLTDGGSVATLSGATSFTPAGSLASSFQLADGGIDRSIANLIIHDYAPAGSSCTATIPNTATANFITLQLFNSDGGAITTGAYTIAEPALPPAGLGASITNQALTPANGAVTVSVAVSGTATVTQLTATRISGSFQSGLFLAADGGMGSLSGTFDTVFCP